MSPTPRPPLSTALATLILAAPAGALAKEGTIAAADGTPIVYEMRGEGNPALVFIHCWACNRGFWREQLDVFAEDHTVVALDLPGHGASGRDRQEWTLEGYGEDVARLALSLGLEEVVLVGHSMGGPVALLAAARLGGRVDAIVCADTLHDADFKMAPEMLEGWIGSFEQDYEGGMRQGIMGMVPGDAALADWVLAEALKADHAAAMALIPEFDRLDLGAAMAGAGVPIRCINAAPYGEYSMVTAVDTNRRYADFDAVLIEGTGHFIQLQKPEEFNAHMRDILEEMAAD
jgi:pimeloyl-ACP methyl ester carboxylesterase